MSTFYIYFFLYKLPKIKYHPAIRQVDILMLKVMLPFFNPTNPTHSNFQSKYKTSQRRVNHISQQHLSRHSLRLSSANKRIKMLIISK